MSRTKTYQASDVRVATLHSANPTQLSLQPIPWRSSTRLNMEALLGEGARFARSSRNIDLDDWLNRGIDAWVMATASSLERILLSGSRETSTVTAYALQYKYLFTYLSEGRETPRISQPSDLAPIHVQEFIGWLEKRAQSLNWTPGYTRRIYETFKAMTLEMMSQGFILGEPTRFFKRGALPSRDEGGKETSLSEAEQERLARAVKQDLVALHHERIILKPVDVQALRLMLVAHRQGINPAPLLELKRDALAPGLLPGTVRIPTFKYRNHTKKSTLGRAAPSASEIEEAAEKSIAFSLSEGAILQKAIASTASLVERAPAWCKGRVWLYSSLRFGKMQPDLVTSLTLSTLTIAIQALVKRHALQGDDGRPLRLNLSRLRKSKFDRAFRIADGDLAITANLMGNTPRVAAVNYPSMNDARKAEAAGFMNADYVGAMRTGSRQRVGESETGPRVIRIQPHQVAQEDGSTSPPENTPVSGCRDSLSGEHAPRDGNNHCDRYVMCLFCASFAIVGTVAGLWRLFSFQAFAREELQYLEEVLTSPADGSEELQDLRDRYRLAIPFIDTFTKKQFAAGNVAKARAKTSASLHPFWVHQMTMSRRAHFMPGGGNANGDFQVPHSSNGA